MTKKPPVIPDKEDLKVGLAKYMTRKERISMILMIVIGIVVVSILVNHYFISGGPESDETGEQVFSVNYKTEKQISDEQKRAARQRKIVEESEKGREWVVKPAVPWKKNDDVWNRVQYKTDFMDNEVKFYLLHYMNSLNDSEIDALAQETKDVDYRDLYHNQENYQGKIIKVAGRLYDFFPRDLGCITLIEKSGVERVWDTTIADIDRNVFRIFVLERRSKQTGKLLPGRNGSVVRCRAVFWKVHRFRSMYEDKENKVFLMVGKFLEKVEPVSAREVYPLQLAVLFIVLFLVTAGVIFIVYRRDQRKSLDFQKEFRQTHPKTIKNEFIKQHVVNPPQPRDGAGDTDPHDGGAEEKQDQGG